jgi:hypothetical protein
MVEGLNLIDFVPATLLGLEVKLSSGNGLIGKLTILSASRTFLLCARGRLHSLLLNMALQVLTVVAIQRPNAADCVVREAFNGTREGSGRGGMVSQGSIS